MSKNTCNLRNREERKELFCEYLVNRLPKLSFSEFEEKIEFLCNRGLSDEWLSVDKITIDRLVCPNSLKIGKIGKDHVYTHLRSFGISDLLNLSKYLKLFDEKRICNYVRRLNTEAVDRMSVVSEIKIASKYIMAGYKVENEPANKKIGKSGLEGKSDLAVKWNDAWIYFEITRKFWGPMVSDQQITEIATLIDGQIKKQNLISPKMRIDAIITDKRKVFSKRWSKSFLEHLGKSSFKLNIWKHFDGIRYIVKYRTPDQGVFLFHAPITSAKRSFTNTIKEESKQIPKNMNGVIVINSDLIFHGYVRYAEETVKSNKFSNILAIIIWRDDDYKIVHRKNILEEFLNFLQIPFIF